MKELLVAKINNNYKILIVDSNLNVNKYFKTNRPCVPLESKSVKTVDEFNFDGEIVKLPCTKITLSGDQFNLKNCRVALSLQGKPYLIELDLDGFNGIKQKAYVSFYLQETENGVVNLDNLKCSKVPTLKDFLQQQKIKYSKSKLEINYNNPEYLKKLENCFNCLTNTLQEETELNIIH